MRPPTTDLGLVVASRTDEDGFIEVQTETDGGSATWSEALYPLGTFAMPADPTADTRGEVDAAGSAQAFQFWIDGKLRVLPVGDPRDVAKIPNLRPGDAGFFSPGHPSTFARARADGSLTLFTTDDGTPDGQSVYLRVRPDALDFVAPWGTLKFDATGFRVKHVSGAELVLGTIAGLPEPLGAIGSYANVRADLVDVSGSVTSIGPEGTEHDATTKATPLTAYLATVAALADAVENLVATFIPGSGAASFAPPAVVLLKAAVEAVRAVPPNLASNTQVT